MTPPPLQDLQTQAQRYLQSCQALHKLIDHLHGFFQSLGYIPFDSSVLQPISGFDPHNRVYQLRNPDGDRMFLRTSPERAMKLHLCLCNQNIYEIGKVFRGGQDNRTGPLHTHEFWMCEWYQMGGTLTSSTVLLETLCSHLWKLYDKKQPWVFESWTFDAVFEQVCHKPLEDWLAETPETCQTERLSEAYAHSFYPWLKARPGFILIHGFPAPMAMLAKPQHSDRPRQRHGRWELHYQSIELLNGYEEIETLSDLTQHVNRYPDLLNHARIHGSQLLDPRTSKILEAHPLPPCAGNALGINRLLMILLGQDQIHKPPCYDSPCYTSGV